jgi:hypothetical protein
MAVALAATLSACSWIAIDPPPRPAAPEDARRCTRESGAPRGDMALFAALLLGSLVVGAVGAAGDGVETSEAAWLSGAGVLGGVFGLSGAYGFHHLGRCQPLNGDFIDAAPPADEPDAGDDL